MSPPDANGHGSGNGGRKVAPCPDCPATGHRRVLLALVPPEADPCRLHCATVSSREVIPARWFQEYGYGLVRRGIVVRQRADAHGRATALDAIGPGSLLVLGHGAASEASVATGYAATDAMVCLIPRAAVESSLRVDGTAVDLLSLHAEALARIERIADARGRPTVRSRVAALLCTLCDTLSPRPRDTVPSGLLQRDLAALIGVRHESVCRFLREAMREGSIERSFDGLRISDRRSLEGQ
jgi:CRP-like cAMP-binding protein